ncbi:putative integral membrane protein [Acidisarcina polymorpha]|uniref:Putative integral membrane protein n=1 Tax=Acidisarcina polymorpha TaxID=2211140 RepID=A0A2Z5G610_9BACT|nr:cation transporter [Acidisarcina polymorpha]AXC14531.1 putative integral membrane protein [Acidisarcina polymorpha]
MSLQVVTLAWMLIECSVALFAAWQARSVSLLAFGSDSLVEVISAGVVLLQFTPRFRISQLRAAQFCGSLLYALAGVVFVIAIAGLLHRVEADTSKLGIAITGGALLLMPLLAQKKRAIAAQTGNKALRADSVQSATCAYLAALTLAGLLLRDASGPHWIDQAAALLAVPILIVEARRARRGYGCSCC